MKWSDGTWLEEVIAIQLVRAAGIPAPKIISYGEHPGMPHAPVSIIMTRMPGEEMSEGLWISLNEESRAAIISELKGYFDAVRGWRRQSSQNQKEISSVLGTSIRSVRVPYRRIGPCQDETEFNQALIEPVCDDLDDFAFLHKQDSNHKIVFTHGDLLPWNLLIHKGHISAIIDWEASGWYPEYWEFSTARQMRSPGDWWYNIIAKLDNDEYTKEVEIDRAVQMLAMDFIG